MSETKLNIVSTNIKKKESIDHANNGQRSQINWPDHLKHSWLQTIWLTLSDESNNSLIRAWNLMNPTIH